MSGERRHWARSRCALAIGVAAAAASVALMPAAARGASRSVSDSGGVAAGTPPATMRGVGGSGATAAAAPVGGVSGAPTGPGGAVAPSGAGGLDTSPVQASTADAAASAPESTGDPLADNGFGSVLCREPSLERSLSAAAQGNCATSSFVAAAAPTGNYAFDVHIDTGLFSTSAGDLLATCIQDFVLVPAWTALVWIVHALLVGIEWCYTLDLLNGATLGSVASALRAVQATLTEPLIAFALATASVLALYHGLVRRRVAQTLAEVLVMLLMMAGGLWVILDPVDTIGTLGQWADQASLGVLASVTAGQPTGGDQSLAGATSELFASAVGGPWCYLEFGNVDWCRDADRLDPGLRSAAQAIASQARGSSTASQRASAMLLGRAQTNGDLFLALPANGPQRNSINDSGSLLRVLCGSSDATSCVGGTASEAEFRTAGGTLARAAGLLLILIGAAGMVAVLAFIVARLLGAAVATLLYLLLAPAIVLAPAFGESGRGAFRTWATRLLGALVSKLVYSLVLGVLLLVLRIVDGLGTLGWWTQWLVVTCLWWTAFLRRHQLLEIVHAPRSDVVAPRSGRARVLRAGTTLLYGRELRRVLRDLRGERLPPEGRLTTVVGKLQPPPGGSSPGGAPGGGDDRRPPDPPTGDRGPGGPGGVLIEATGGAPTVDARRARRRTMIAETAQRTRGGDTPLPAPIQPGTGRPGGRRAGPREEGSGPERLARLEREHEAARAAGDTRRAVSLQLRADALRRELSAGDVSGGGGAQRRDERHDARAETAAPLTRRRDEVTGQRRRLGPLTGLAAVAHSQLPAGQQRDAREAIDHELDERRRVSTQPGTRSAQPGTRSGQPGSTQPGTRSGGETARDGAAAAAARTSGASATPSQARASATPVRASTPVPTRDRAGRRDAADEAVPRPRAATDRPERPARGTAADSVVVRRERQFARSRAGVVDAPMTADEMPPERR